MNVVIKHATGQLKPILEGIRNGEEVMVELEGHTFTAVPQAAKRMVRSPDLTSSNDLILENSNADDWKYWMENPVDFVELTQFFQMLENFCKVLDRSISILFDSKDDSKPRIGLSRIDQAISNHRMYFNFSLRDFNSKTNHLHDEDYFECVFGICRESDLFIAELEMNNVREDRIYDAEIVPLIEKISVSKSNWHDLHGRINAEFQKIQIGRSLLQYLLRDFYSEDRYEQFKTEAIKKLQEHSLEHLIQP
jgi:hypothetical protein